MSDDDVDTGDEVAAAFQPTTDPTIEAMSFEAARDELLSIVARLEGRSVDLEQSMSLWERGEALAAHCSLWLDGAQAKLDEAGRRHQPPA